MQRIESATIGAARNSGASRRPWLIYACLSVFLSACGGSKGPPSNAGETPPAQKSSTTIGGIERLSLGAFGPRDGSVPIRLHLAELRQHSPQGVRSGKEGLEPEIRTFKGIGDVRAVWMEAADVDIVDIRIPQESRSCNRVLIHYQTDPGPHAATLLGSLRSFVTPDLHHYPAKILPSLKGQSLELIFPDSGRRTAPPQELRLRIMSRGMELGLQAIEFWHVPPRQLFSTEPDEPRLIALQQFEPLAAECVRGYGMSENASFAAEVTVPADRLLEFSLGLSIQLSLQEGSGHFLLECIDSKDRVHTLVKEPLKLDTSLLGWKLKQVSMERFTGETVTLVFKLEHEEEGEAVLALGQPRWVAQNVDTDSLPTVLLITSDTHRGDHLGSASRSVSVQTPHLDALAARGVLFDEGYSTTNITNPSHVSILTGIHPRDTGITDNRTPLSETARTLAEAYARNGYRTVATLSTAHLGPEVSGLGQGFDMVSFPHALERVAPDTLASLDKQLEIGANTPLFIWLHLFDAHGPYVEQEGFTDIYWDGTRDPYDPDLPDLKVPLPPNLVGLKDLDYPRALYRAEVSYVDDQLARIFDLPRVRQGVVAFTGDHGECLGEQGVYFTHAGLFPATTRVPLILAWPGAPAGKRVTEVAQNHDLGRTLLNLSGMSHEHFPGRDLTALEELGSVAVEGTYFLGSHGSETSIIKDGHYLMLNLLRENHPLMARLRPQGMVQLFNLEQDPDCATDLADVEQYKQIRKRLMADLLDWLDGQESLGLAGIPSTEGDLNAALIELGYQEPKEERQLKWIHPRLRAELREALEEL